MAFTFYCSSSDYTDITDRATTGATIVISNVYRPLRKAYTRHKVEIPGRAGAWDFGGGVARDYTISVDMIITASRSSDVMATAAAIQTKLDTKQSIWFSDSTGTRHIAQVFSEIMLTPEPPGNVARLTVDFECDATT